MVAAGAARPGRGGHRDDLVDIFHRRRGEPSHHGFGEAGAEKIGPLELEREENRARRSPVGRRAFQPRKRRRIEQAAAAGPGRVGPAGKRLVAAAAALPVAGRNRAPAGRAHAPAAQLIDLPHPAGEADRRQGETGGGPNDRGEGSGVKRLRRGLRKPESGEIVPLGAERIREVAFFAACRVSQRRGIDRAGGVVLTWKRWLLAGLAIAAVASPLRAQMFGAGGTYGSVNDVTNTFTLDGFKPSEWTVFFDYRFEQAALLRVTYGSMWTQQALVGQTVNTPQGPVFVPTAKEHVNYLSIDADYLYAEGFYTGGVFGGIGGYQYNPDPMPPGYEAFQDPNQKYFGSTWGGALATAGGVVFYGTLEGYLKAVDAKTGKELYKFKTPSGIIGNVMTYEHGGRQYVAVLSGVGGWAGIGLAAGLLQPENAAEWHAAVDQGKLPTKEKTVDTAGLGAVGGYAGLASYTALGGTLTVFALPSQ